MSYQKGEDVNVGFARETTRGTAETPSMWMPARVPAGIQLIVDKVPIRETRGSGVSSQGSTVVQRRAEGDVEFNVRNNSIGFLFLSLLGSISTSTLVTGVYQHIFTILTGNPQFPTLTTGLSKNGSQDYKYARTLVTALEIRTPVNDLVNATASLLAADETTNADFTPSFDLDVDQYFRHYDLTIKVADDVAGLGAASAFMVKEFSLSIINNGRVNQNISQLTPGDVLAVMHEITGSMKVDYDGEAQHDWYEDGAYKAMSISMVRADVDIDAAGTTANPTITIVLPKVSIETLTNDRPIDDIVMEEFGFTAHFDEDEAQAIEVTVINNTANYD